MGCVYALELPLITLRLVLVHSLLDELGGEEVSMVSEGGHSKQTRRMIGVVGQQLGVGLPKVNRYMPLSFFAATRIFQHSHIADAHSVCFVCICRDKRV